MRRKLFVLCAALALMLAVCGSALAVEDPIRVFMDVNPLTFTAPQTANVSIQVINTGDSEMPGPVTLYDPNGDQIEAFGSPILAAGSSKVWEGTWDVTQEQLDAGKITFRLRYYIYDDSGELAGKNKGFSKPISYEGAVTSLEVNRTISPTTAGNGQKVTVTYDVINTGNTELTDVTIAEDKSISTKKQTIAKVAPGTKESVTFTVTMGKKDLTSAATITYKAGGETRTMTKEAAVIAYGEMNLSAALAADKKGGAPGDTVKLTLTLKNSGKTDYTDVTVSDPLLGEIFRDQTVPAGKTVTLEKEIVIIDTANYQFTVSATNASGRTVETTTSQVPVQAVAASDVIRLTVEASADREVVYELPGTVRFRVAVTNNSSSDVKNVSVAASGVTLYRFPTIMAGETREFTRDVNVSMAGQYQFVAATVNQLSETVRFNSNIIYISYAMPTAVPTTAPIVTPPAPKLEQMPTAEEVMAETAELQSNLHLAAYVLLGIGALGLLLVMIGFIRSAAHKRQIKDAVDVIDRRDYSVPYGKPDSYEATKPVEVNADTAADEPADTQDERVLRRRTIQPEELNRPDNGPAGE